MYNSNIILQIQATYNQLTKAEKKVADYVLQNKKEVLYMSITDLADACERNNGLWNSEAEQILLKYYGVI